MTDPLMVFRFGEDGRMYVHGEEVVLASAVRAETAKLRAAWRDDKAEWEAKLAAYRDRADQLAQTLATCMSPVWGRSPKETETEQARRIEDARQTLEQYRAWRNKQ